MIRYLTGFSPQLPTSLTYMLQASEYNLGEYLAWFWRAPDLRHVQHRRHLELTPKARLLRTAGYIIWVAIIVLVVRAALTAYLSSAPLWYAVAALLLVALPILTAYLLAIPLALGRLVIQKPRERAIIAHATSVIQNHPGVRIAIAGSYGKTTFKETLRTVLAAGKAVAATPGNMNTPLGISRFAARLTGHEDVLIMEFGEYRPGDIRDFCNLTHPDIGVITGINEAHLSNFITLDAIASNIFILADYLGAKPVYKNGDNELVRSRTTPDDPFLYTAAGVNHWQVSNVKIALDHTSFTAKLGKTTIHAKSGLLGPHQIGPLVAAIDIAGLFNLTPTQIEAGLAATQPFEHRMQPRQLSGATIVDDTYNGNPDGVRAGLAWLAAVPARRRIYVTPGLVEQGSRTAAVHEDIGRALAATLTNSSDIVVLVKNSVTNYIEKGLHEGKFAGQLQIITNPLRFYTNLDQFVAAGDVVLLQNDWPDNYS